MGLTRPTAPLLTQGNGVALKEACGNGRLEVVEYLWANFDDTLILKALNEQYIDAGSLSRLLRHADFSHCARDICLEKLLVLICSPTSTYEYDSVLKAVVIEALVCNEKKALNDLLQRAESRDEWTDIRNLMALFTARQRVFLSGQMSKHHASLCGLIQGSVVGSERPQPANTARPDEEEPLEFYHSDTSGLDDSEDEG